MSDVITKDAAGVANPVVDRQPNVKAPEVKVQNAGSNTNSEDFSTEGVYAFVSNVPGSRAYVGQMVLDDETIFDGWCTFNPTGKALANAMMPGIIFHSHGVFVTASKKIADALLLPLKARRPMLYRQYNPSIDPEVTAYLKDPKGKCVIEGVCE